MTESLRQLMGSVSYNSLRRKWCRIPAQQYAWLNLTACPKCTKDPLQISKSCSSLTWGTRASTHSLWACSLDLALLLIEVGTIYWWHQNIVCRRWMWLAWLLLVFGKHEFDWDSTSCWSIWWLGISAQTSLAGQQIEDTSRRSFSESQQSGKTWLAGQQIENTSRRSFAESEQSGKTWLAGQQIENTSRRSFSESQ